MNMKRSEQIVFKVSDNLHIGDPCYKLENEKWCVTVPALPGRWIGYVQTATFEDWGTRVWKLTARHESAADDTVVDEIGEVGVDAGCMKIMDLDYFKEHAEEVFHDALDGSEALFRQLTDYGVLSDTGLGDGIYPVFAGFDEAGLAVKVEIEFLRDR